MNQCTLAAERQGDARNERTLDPGYRSSAIISVKNTVAASRAASGHYERRRICTKRNSLRAVQYAKRNAAQRARQEGRGDNAGHSLASHCALDFVAQSCGLSLPTLHQGKDRHHAPHSLSHRPTRRRRRSLCPVLCRHCQHMPENTTAKIRRLRYPMLWPIPADAFREDRDDVRVCEDDSDPHRVRTCRKARQPD